MSFSYLAESLVNEYNLQKTNEEVRGSISKPYCKILNGIKIETIIKLVIVDAKKYTEHGFERKQDRVNI
jgi:hypothetical protein